MELRHLRYFVAVAERNCTSLPATVRASAQVAERNVRELDYKEPALDYRTARSASRRSSTAASAAASRVTPPGEPRSW